VACLVNDAAAESNFEQIPEYAPLKFFGIFEKLGNHRGIAPTLTIL